MSRSTRLLFGVILILALAPAHADDLTGANKLVCASMTVAVCFEDGDCELGTAAALNIPQFIEIDLTQNRLSTTKASGENRSTPITNLLRDQGQIVLQGFEGGRAFSFVISEETGRASVAVARDGRTVGVFGACTPVTSSR